MHPVTHTLNPATMDRGLREVLLDHWMTRGKELGDKFNDTHDLRIIDLRNAVSTRANDIAKAAFNEMIAEF